MDGIVVILPLIVVGAVFLVFIPVLLMFLSHHISLLGLYHTLDSEPFWEKYLKVLYSYMMLTGPFIFGFYLLINSVFGNVPIRVSLTISLVLTLASLVAMRIICNPSGMHLKPKLLHYVNDLNDRSRLKKKKRIVDNHKERMEAFFFSLIGAAIIGLVIWGLILFYNFLTDTKNSPIVIADTAGIINNLNYLIEIFIIYIGTLLLFTLIGELILRISKPCVQYPKQNPGQPNSSPAFTCD